MGGNKGEKRGLRTDHGQGHAVDLVLVLGFVLAEGRVSLE